MASRFLLALALLGACAQEHSSAPGDACELARSMLSEALLGARAGGEPACTEDADCVILHTGVYCDNILDIRDCGQVVHRVVRDRYVAAPVSERICSAVQGAEYGCSVMPSCAAGLVPSCSAGQCVADRP
jgi:hypothetical protein